MNSQFRLYSAPRYPKGEDTTYRSPYNLCLFLLGLRPGVRSRCRLAFSISFSLRVKASASIVSVDVLCTLAELSPCPRNRLLEMVGGVLEPTGVGSEGVRGLFILPRMAVLLWSSSMAL